MQLIPCVRQVRCEQTRQHRSHRGPERLGLRRLGCAASTNVPELARWHAPAVCPSGFKVAREHVSARHRRARRGHQITPASSRRPSVRPTLTYRFSPCCPRRRGQRCRARRSPSCCMILARGVLTVDAVPAPAVPTATACSRGLGSALTALSLHEQPVCARPTESGAGIDVGVLSQGRRESLCHLQTLVRMLTSTWRPDTWVRPLDTSIMLAHSSRCDRGRSLAMRSIPGLWGTAAWQQNLCPAIESRR